MTERSYIFDHDTAHAVTRDEATAALGQAQLVWVHFDQCDAPTETWLREQGKLPPLAVAALVATETRPRSEAVGDKALLNLRGLDGTPDDNADMLSSVRLWAEGGRVFTVTRKDLAALADVDAAMAAGKIRDPGDFIAALATAITTGLDPDVAALGDLLDDCEEMFGPNNALALRRTIAETRAKAIAYRRFVAPQRAALDKLAMLEASWLNDDDRLHLREAADRAARMAEELEAIRERSALIHEQLTDLRAELTETRGLVISVVALVFLPLTFLTGLLGMNVDGIPYAHQPWAFAAVVAVCVAIAVAVGWYFIRARWFR